jgi:hypothetical protein
MSEAENSTFKEENENISMPKKKFCRVPTHLKKVKGKKKRIRVKGYIRKC